MYSQSQGVPLESTPVVSHGVPVSSGHTVTVSAGVPIHAVSGAPVGQPVGVVHGAVSHGHPLGAVPETIKPVLSIENPVLPFISDPLPVPSLKQETLRLVFRGSVPPNASWFCINIQTGPGFASQPESGGDVLLHLRPDFPSYTIIKSSRVNGVWGTQSHSPFSLTPGSPFKLTVLILPQSPSSSANTVKVFLNGIHFAEHSLPNPYLPPNIYVTIEAQPGGLRIRQMQEFFIPSTAIQFPVQSPAASCHSHSHSSVSTGTPISASVGYSMTTGASVYPSSGHHHAEESHCSTTSDPAPTGKQSGMMGNLFGKAAPILGGALAAASQTGIGKRFTKK